MPSTESASVAGDAAQKALCVSMHDVSPHTWPQCERLLEAIRQVDDIPVTLLVVPAYHRLPEKDDYSYRQSLERRIAKGDELALHGYTHLDEGPPATSWSARFVRHAYTQSEGEFSALDEAEARRRIDLGLAWFARHGWPVQGFVAPAYLMSRGAWEAVTSSPFRYATTMRCLHLLSPRRDLAARSMFYAARNASGRLASRVQNDLLVKTQRHAPLMRFGLHPRDANHPDLIRHLQKTLETLLPHRTPMTKIDFVSSIEKRTNLRVSVATA